LTYERAKIVPFGKPKTRKKDPLSIVPNPAYDVSKIDLAFKQKGKLETVIHSSGDAYDVLLKAWDENTLDLREEGKALYLNRANYVLSVFDNSKGGITGTVMDPRHIIYAALEQNATSIILAHNHPSGGLKPSRQDEELTSKISQAAKFFDLKVLDHVIMSRNGYFSFADEGLVI
jgi:DNA repair protein RadC